MSYPTIVQQTINKKWHAKSQCLTVRKKYVLPSCNAPNVAEEFITFIFKLPNTVACVINKGEKKRRGHHHDTNPNWLYFYKHRFHLVISRCHCSHFTYSPHARRQEERWRGKWPMNQGTERRSIKRATSLSFVCTCLRAEESKSSANKTKET